MTFALPGTFLLACAALTFLTGYQSVKKAGWAGRGIHPVLPWGVVISTQVVAALAVVPYFYGTWGSGPAIAGSAFVWLGVLAVATDLKTRKVPYDIAHPVALLGLALFATDYTIEGALSLGAAIIGLVGVPFVARAITNKGLGMSDIRLLWAATAACSWWIGQNWLLYAVIVACLIQIPIKALCHLMDWGPMVPAHDPPDTQVSGSILNAPTRIPSTPSTPDTQATSDASVDIKSHPPEDSAPEVRMRRELPFAPALIAALVAALIYGTSQAYGACLMWNVLGTCTVTIP